MSVLGYIGLALFLLFCIGLIWQLHSDMKEPSRCISRGYAFSNITHSAQVFEKTGVDLLGDIDYLADERPITSQKKSKSTKPKKDSKFNFEI